MRTCWNWILVNCCWECKMLQLLPSPSLVCSSHHRPTNLSFRVLRQGGDLIRGTADQEDGRLAPQNNHLIRVWMPGYFIDQRERSNEELKSKGRLEKEMQWGNKVKASSVLQSISKGMSSRQKRCVNLVCSQVGRDKLSLHQLNKGTLIKQRGRVLQASHWVWL